MTVLNYVLLAVANPQKSAELYTKLLGTEPVENSPTFVLYVTKIGLKLGLWRADDMTPAAGKPGGSELALSAEDKVAVDATYKAWTGWGVSITQQPTNLDFGYTFVALDDDGHKLRVFTPADNPR